MFQKFSVVRICESLVFLGNLKQSRKLSVDALHNYKHAEPKERDVVGVKLSLLEEDRETEIQE